MRLADDSESESEPVLTDLLWGITPKHIRILCDNSWQGGREYTPSEVGNLTLDQFFCIVADIKDLRSGQQGTRKFDPLEIKPDSDGMVKGRTADGKPMKAKILGKSLATRLREEREEKEKKQARKAARMERRKRRGNRTS